MSQSHSSLGKTFIGLAALIALAAGIWFGIQQSKPIQQESEQISAAEQAAIKKVINKAAPPKPNNIKDVAFLLDIDLQDTQAKSFKVSEKLQHITLVNFWATWCAPCREEMPIFDEVFQKHHEKGFGVLGLTIDNPQATDRFIQQLGISYPILMAENQGWDLLAKTGNPKNLMPYSFLIDRKGIILEKKLGSLHAEELEAWIQKYL